METTATKNRTARVEIVLDVICIWSYLAFARYRRAADRFREDGGRVELSIRPFQVDPAAVGGRSKQEESIAAFGADALARVEALAAADGTPLDFARAVTANTFEAHRLIAAAAAQGRAEQMTARLFAAHFVDGLDIGDAATLQGLAAEIGVTWTDGGADALRAELAAVRAGGVAGVPVFRFGRKPALTGALAEDALFGAMINASEDAR